MQLIQRYIFRQLLAPTLWALAALSGVGVLSQSLAALELIVDQRQSVWVFLKVTALGMPQIISLIMPMAVFVAALISLNRLQSEQEFVVCYAGGVSRWRVMAPALRLALCAALIALITNLWVAPWSLHAMNAQINAARADFAAAVVKDGQFTTPAPGLTVYAQNVERGGSMKNLFIHQEDPKTGRSVTYTANEGRLIRQAGRPILLMSHGAIQEMTEDNVLNYLSFGEYPFDLQPFMGSGAPPRPKASDRYMSELLHPEADDEWARKNRTKLLAEAHSRITSPLYNLVLMALALNAVLGGAFSRLGYARRIAVTTLVALVVRIMGFILQGAANNDPALNVAQYLFPLAVFAGTVGMMIGGRMKRGPAGPAPAALPEIA